MLKFIKNDRGVIGITLSQIGLVIATGIILAAIFSFLYYSEWQRNSELKNMASGLSIMVEGMDTRFFDNTTTYFFPDKNYNYNVSVSSEYIIINADGTWGNMLSVKERFLIRPWPRVNDPDWTSGKQLHSYLQDNYGRSGNKTRPIYKSDISSVKNMLNSYKEQDEQSLALNPLFVDILKPVYIDKVFIHYDTDGDNIWNKKNDEKQGFLLVYQQ
jgi:hypothetical protein